MEPLPPHPQQLRARTFTEFCNFARALATTCNNVTHQIMFSNLMDLCSHVLLGELGGALRMHTKFMLPILHPLNWVQVMTTAIPLRLTDLSILDMTSSPSRTAHDHAIWFMIHYTAALQQSPERMRSLITTLQELMPGELHRKTLVEYVQQYDIPQHPQDLFTWSHALHQHVNDKLGKLGITLTEAQQLYKNVIPRPPHRLVTQSDVAPLLSIPKRRADWKELLRGPVITDPVERQRVATLQEPARLRAHIAYVRRTQTRETGGSGRIS